MPSDVREVVDRFWGKVWLHADVEGASAHVMDDVVFHLFGSSATGVEAWKESANVYFAAFPDFRASIDFIIVEGEMLTARWTASGTHQGELRGVAPTGRQIEISGAAIFRVHRGKIAEIWSQPDQLGMLQQLGVV
jgi:steroid delta-isomerase-like uncharacterized protein